MKQQKIDGSKNSANNADDVILWCEFAMFDVLEIYCL